jgi:hypothetical protein
MDGWMDGRESGVKDCLQQSKIIFVNKDFFERHLTSFNNKSVPRFLGH